MTLNRREFVATTATALTVGTVASGATASVGLDLADPKTSDRWHRQVWKVTKGATAGLGFFWAIEWNSIRGGDTILTAECRKGRMTLIEKFLVTKVLITEKEKAPYTRAGDDNVLVFEESTLFYDSGTDGDTDGEKIRTDAILEVTAKGIELAALVGDSRVGGWIGNPNLITREYARRTSFNIAVPWIHFGQKGYIEKEACGKDWANNFQRIMKEVDQHRESLIS